ncbi:hypothetical protein GYM62_09345 [Algoriphagus sp. NBT04N3]|uniref:hypothetical protein n=1 Tax=Algoriphagus sp. NBT04N3 TaxID=2705473 RepID=UPI001C6341D7|nr:hypothetical protein [Algoriphagus sp. NBT04N3]QYH38985.1 hypothetical protein GYM62_09345 [Algoriphagus sp. NBT04N3]
MNKKYLKSCIYIFLLVALSGNPYFNLGGKTSQYLFSIFVIFLSLTHLSYFYPVNKKNIPFFIYIISFIFIFIVQRVNLGFLSFPSAIGFLLKITFGYIIIRYLNCSFKNYYLNILYIISLISLFGYSITLFGFDLPNFLNESKTTYKSIIIYTENVSDISQGIRNSGMFWEPGAFAGYICLLFLFYLGEIRILILENKFKLFIILLSFFTTFSTTGYLILFFLLIITILKEFSSKYRIFSIFLSSVLFALICIIYLNTDFLYNKVSNQLAASSNLGGEFSNSRFGSFVFDLHYIKKNPLSGNGFHEKTRYIDHQWLQGEELGHGNGFSNFIASMGILGLLIIIIFLLIYYKRSNLIFLVAFIGLLQGEQFLNFPLFLSLPFVFLYENNNSSSFNLS